ncbi:MAG: hypothetical protein ACLR4A_14100 [Christensenellales bacterium]
MMETLTDQPGVQVYTACGTDIPGGKGGTHYGKYCAVSPETQHFPIRRITRSSSARRFYVPAKSTTRRRFTRSARNDPLC